jgi:ElaB/YqjD/DUF883 family membrane-anchored ribosome-binding protein
LCAGFDGSKTLTTNRPTSGFQVFLQNACNAPITQLQPSTSAWLQTSIRLFYYTFCSEVIMVTQQQHSASNPSPTRDEKAGDGTQEQDLKTQKTKAETKPESLETTLEEIRAELSELKASMKVLLAKHEPKSRSGKTKANENEDADPVGEQTIPLSQQIRDLVEDLQNRQAKLKSGVEHQVQDQPIATLGMAFGLGMVISRLMRGRK